MNVDKYVRLVYLLSFFVSNSALVRQVDDEFDIRKFQDEYETLLKEFGDEYFEEIGFDKQTYSK